MAHTSVDLHTRSALCHAGLLSRALHYLATALDRRRAQAELTVLDDRMLADIGISRADIYRVTGRDAW